jgi:hypothetical protein
MPEHQRGTPLLRLAAARPEDGLADFYKRRLEVHLARDPCTPWDGVDRFDQK